MTFATAYTKHFPDELIGALLLLVSPNAGSFITGTHINVDGGFTAAWF